MCGFFLIEQFLQEKIKVGGCFGCPELSPLLFKWTPFFLNASVPCRTKYGTAMATYSGAESRARIDFSKQPFMIVLRSVLDTKHQADQIQLSAGSGSFELHDIKLDAEVSGKCDGAR
jgi:hypothetical protein